MSQGVRRETRRCQVLDAWLAAFAAAATKCSCSQILITYACPAAISAAAGDVSSRRVIKPFVSSRLCGSAHKCMLFMRADA